MTVPALRFERCPCVSNRPQKAADGREFKIERIAMPLCWAVEIGVDEGKLYRLVVERRSVPRAAAPADPDRRKAYRKLRSCGVSRADAMTELRQPDIEPDAERERLLMPPPLPWDAPSLA